MDRRGEKHRPAETNKTEIDPDLLLAAEVRLKARLVKGTTPGSILVYSEAMWLQRKALIAENGNNNGTAKK